MASTIAFAIAFFLIEITVKLVSKTDDVYHETVIAYDDAIIINNIKEKIKDYIIETEGVSNSANQAAIENAHMNPFVLITVTVIMAPIVEELIFRGLLMGRVFNPDSIVGLILSSLLFGLAHMPNSIGVWIVYAGMGFVLGTVYRKCQKLEYCIMAHMINNSIAVSMMLLLQFLAPYIK